MGVAPPSGTVTFLFTDIEGSTALWEQHPDEMSLAVERHDHLLRGIIEAHRGYVFTTAGDAFAAAFARVGDGLAAASSAQRALGQEDWPNAVDIRVRMALHVGEAEERDGDYFGPVLNRAARLMSAGGGGRILVSAVCAELSRSALPEGVGLVDLGLHRLRDLSGREHVFDLVYPDRPSEVGVLRTVDTMPGNLPHRRAPLLGREKELRRLVADVGEHRLVTVSGVGGVGKTSLALALAAELQPQFDDGVWLVELGGVVSREAVVAVTSAVLGVESGGASSALEALVSGLAPRDVLVVLDNCEHVLDAVAEMVEAVSDRCPGVRLVLTSREALGADEERVRRVLPLAELDDEGDGGWGPAVELFCQRANAVDDAVVWDRSVIEDVAAICRRLDGLPLAIELAASRIRSMTPAEIRGRLDDRFRLLTGAAHRGSVERHQTLQATVDWSYVQLSEIDAAVFARLSVFTGGFTTDAAETVAAGVDLDSWDVVDAVDSLVAKSLLVADTTGTIGRFRMLETIRVYALDRLAEAGEIDAIRDAHLRYYAGLCEYIQDKFWGSDGVEATSAGLREIDNLRTAFETALDRSELDIAQRIAGSDFLNFLAYLAEVGQDWAPRSLAGGHVGTWTAQACALAAWGAMYQADLDRALDYYEQGRRAIAAGAHNSGSVARARAAIDRFGDPHTDEALDVIDEEVAAAELSGDLARLALDHCFRTMLAVDESIITVSNEQMIHIAAQLDSPIVAAYSATRHAAIAFVQGDANAEQLLDVGIELSRTIGLLVGELHSRTFRALIWADTDRVTEALAELNDIARRWRFAADRRSWSALREIATIHATHGDPTLAARLLGKLHSLAFPVLPNRRDPDQDEHLQQALSELLGAETLSVLMAEGAELDEEHAFALPHNPPPS